MSVTNAIAVQDRSVTNLVPQYRMEFADVLPAHIKPDTYVRLAVGVLRRDPDLRAVAEANPASFIHALRECARLGHEPGSDQYALTHFKNNKTGVPEIVGIEQYQGEIERMYRAGAALSVKCEVVRANDHFEWSPTEMRVPVHRYDALASEAERGGLRGVYAFAEMRGGALSQVVVMGRDEVMRHKAVARSTKFWEGPWERSMWKKTAIHELEKWVPTSSEYLREHARAVAEVQNEKPAPVNPAPLPTTANPETGEVIEAELVPDGAA